MKLERYVVIHVAKHQWTNE